MGQFATSIAITLLIAIGTAIVQMIIRTQSKPNPPNTNVSFGLEDALFWSDWTVAGALALGSACFANSQKQLPIPVGTVSWTFVAIGVGLVGLPFFLRVWAYKLDNNVPVLRELWPWKIGWVIIANFFGLALLFFAVFAGVKVYG